MDSSQSQRSQTDRSILTRVQFSELDMAAERGTWDETEATRQRAHDQRIRLEAADSDGLRHVVQFAVGGDS